VVRHEGGVLGLFKGLGATLGRESLGNMAMFGVYELIKQQMVASKVRQLLAGCRQTRRMLLL
jgi:solute carrier family 25 carnitine/acylcarnitine transporter 20/29